MNILFVSDVYAWSLGNIGRGYKKYSKFKVDHLDRNDFHSRVLLNEFPKYDIVVYMLWGEINVMRSLVGVKLKDMGTKVVVGLWTDSNPDYGNNIPECIKAFVYGDNNVYKQACNTERVKNISKYFLPEGVDHNLFVSKDKPEGFLLGWAGNYTRTNKRTHLLDKLNYNVKVQTPKTWEEFKAFLDEKRGQEEMVDFYNSINCFVYVSSVEGGQSTTILEAMSSGLPVVCTSAGSEIVNLLDPEWIVPTDPEEEVIKQMNEKLTILANDKDLCVKIGNRNRKYIEDNYSWEQKAKYYDQVFEKIMNG